MASSDFRTLEQALDYQFKKRELIIEALTHRSHHHEFGDSLHNERLEFLGDSVIDLCVTEALMRLSPDTDEGKLSKLRSQLVSESSLARAARRLGLGQAVRLGKGEDQSGGRERDALLADTFEAVLAAVYLDGGFEVARRLTLKTLEVGAGRDATPWTEATEKLLRRDFKSRLQELCQSVGLGAPSYKCVETRGPDHQRRFVMALFVLDHEAIRSEGATKKEATQEAAREVLDKTAASPDALLRFLSERGVPVQNEARRGQSSKSPSKVKSKPAARPIKARAAQEGSHEH